jgi:nucleoside-diphosphate-sugar epimerase
MNPTPSTSTARRQVLVLGANGHIGQACVQAFAAAGWHVVAQVRRPPATPFPAGVRTLQCDALDSAAIIHGAAGSAIVVNGLNPPYTRWAAMWPPLAEAALQVARALDARLMLPGNVYNFGRALPAVLREDTPFVADHDKAQLRIALEARLAAAAQPGGAAPPVRSVVIRAGDFLGAPGTWLDLGYARALDHGKVTHMGPDDLEHAWAFLPDLARVFVAVAEREGQLGGFEVLHYAGLSCTGAQLQQALQQLGGRELQRANFPWWVIRAAALVWPMGRELLKMRYLWQRPHRLDESRLAALIGPVPHTSLERVLRASLTATAACAATVPA